MQMPALGDVGLDGRVDRRDRRGRHTQMAVLLCPVLDSSNAYTSCAEVAAEVAEVTAMML